MNKLIGKPVLVIEIKHVSSTGLVSHSESRYLVKDKEEMDIDLEFVKREFNPNGFNPGEYGMKSHMPIYDWMMPPGESCLCTVTSMEFQNWYLSNQFVSTMSPRELFKRVNSGPIEDFEEQSKKALKEHLERLSSLI